MLHGTFEIKIILSLIAENEYLSESKFEGVLIITHTFISAI